MKLYKLFTILIFLFFLMGCTEEDKPIKSFAEMHVEFKTNITTKVSTGLQAPKPPKGVLSLVYYDSPAGELAAYVSVNPHDGMKHPAVIWIVGGFENSIDSYIWEDNERANDQSASAFYKSGIITMYPSLRGGNENPGNIEILYGEVDDIISAFNYLSSLDYVDSERIYLGGHSTGGTLALLTAESFDGFQGIFALGPVGYMEKYGSDYFLFDESNQDELIMRSPIYWLGEIKTPTFVFEGEHGNYGSLQELENANKNPLISFYTINDAGHFNIVAPLTELIASKIFKDQLNISFSKDELYSMDISK